MVPRWGAKAAASWRGTTARGGAWEVTTRSPAPGAAGERRGERVKVEKNSECRCSQHAVHDGLVEEFPVQFHVLSLHHVHNQGAPLVQSPQAKPVILVQRLFPERHDDAGGGVQHLREGERGQKREGERARRRSEGLTPKSEDSLGTTVVSFFHMRSMSKSSRARFRL